MAEQTVEAAALRQFARPARHPAVDATIRILRTPLGAASTVVLAVLVLGAVFAPLAVVPT